MDYRLVFDGPGIVNLEPMQLSEPKADEVRLRTIRSLISAGTEGICLHRRFAPDTHWDRWVKYPFYPGYTSVSVVESVGAEVRDLAVGDRVATRTPHAAGAVVSANRAFRIPDSLSTEDACWFSLAKIAFVGIRAAEPKVGENLLVIGAGPIGQMALRWAVAAGTNAVSLDPVAARLEHSVRGGATATICRPAAEARDAVSETFGGDRPRVVIDTTGHAAVFMAALGLVADRGRVVLLGDPGAPSEQRLTPDLITRGINVVGAHDLHLPETQSSYDPFFALATSGRFSLAGLNTHTFTPDCAEAAYELATTTTNGMGVEFRW